MRICFHLDYIETRLGNDMHQMFPQLRIHVAGVNGRIKLQCSNIDLQLRKFWYMTG